MKNNEYFKKAQDYLFESVNKLGELGTRDPNNPLIASTLRDIRIIRESYIERLSASLRDGEIDGEEHEKHLFGANLLLNVVKTNVENERKNVSRRIQEAQEARRQHENYQV